MKSNVFGGTWTQQKLDVIEKYLKAYLTLMRANPRAQYYTKTYVDAFAGSGYRERREIDAVSRDLGFDEEASALIAGSALRAHGLKPPFDKYLFIERNPRALASLKNRVSRESDSNTKFVQGDANEKLVDYCRATDWRRNRAVVFLDPYGLQVDWDTLVELGRTGGVDMWMLFPIGVGVNRLLTTDGPPDEAWAYRLTRTFGTDEWLQAFYQHEAQVGLFGPVLRTTKTAHLESIAEFMLTRLRNVFAHVCTEYLVLYNSRRSPMFILVFAAAAQRGGDKAVKIAKDILIRELRKIQA